LDFSDNRSKSARLRAICDSAWTRRAAPAALIRRKWQNLSGLDSSGSTDVRSHFAFIDRIQTKGHTRASVAPSIGANGRPQRRSGSILDARGRAKSRGASLRIRNPVLRRVSSQERRATHLAR
jgi:hypothetical protein